MEGDRDTYNATPADVRARRQFSRHFKHIRVKDDLAVQHNACDQRQLLKHLSCSNLDKKYDLDVQHDACNFRSDELAYSSMRVESPWSSDTPCLRCHGSPRIKVIPKILVSNSDFEADRESGGSDAGVNCHEAIGLSQSPLSEATLQTAESLGMNATSSLDFESLDQWYVTKLLLQLQTDPKRFSKKLADQMASCGVRHETAADIIVLASRGYVEPLLDNGVLQSLLVMLSSSLICCRAVAIHTIRVLLHSSLSHTKEDDCQMANLNKMKKLKGFLACRFSKSSLLAFLDQHDKAVKQLMVLVRCEDSDDAIREDAVDILQFFVEQTACWSSFKKHSVVSTLLVLLAVTRNDSLLNSLVNLLVLLPEKMLLANVCQLYDAVPALTGLLSSPNPEVVLAVLSTLRVALQNNRLFCLAFLEAQGLCSLEPLLYFSRTTRPALELMWLLASHSWTHEAFLNNRSLPAVVDVAESADQQSVLMALELLTTLSRCNRGCSLKFLHHEAVPVLQKLVERGDRLVARTATVALHALSGVVRS